MLKGTLLNLDLHCSRERWLSMLKGKVLNHSLVPRLPDIFDRFSTVKVTKSWGKSGDEAILNQAMVLQ